MLSSVGEDWLLIEMSNSILCDSLFDVWELEGLDGDG